MKVMVMVKATPSSEAGMPPPEGLFEAMNAYNEELVKHGIMLAGEGLKPSSAGARVRFSGGNRTVTDGPFAETNELVAGYWLWQVKSMEEAIEWVKRCPNPMPEDSEIEIRPLYEMADYADWDPSGELIAAEEKMREEIARYTLEPPRFETGAALRIVGFNGTYTFETRTDIPSQWERFGPHCHNLPGANNDHAYGVCWNYRAGVGFDYLTGMAMDGDAPVPEGMVELRLAPARYAVFTHSGNVSTIADTLDAIWSKWLPNSGHEAADAPSFERYDARFDPMTGDGGFEVWVALKP
jgi:predicted transcriptional regulator YdeE